MAKGGFFSFVDEKLEELFNRKPHDPSKDRKRALEHIDKCEEQYRNPPEKGRKFVVTRGDTTKFAPRYRFGGKDAHFIPRERFPDAMKVLRQEITNGHHDDVIGASSTGTTRRGSGKGWTPERRAAYQATMAKKKGSK